MGRKVIAFYLSLAILFGFAVIVIEVAPKVTAYTTHNPVRINSNTELSLLAGSEGWIGDGSPANPYIIEGYDINGSGYGYCIYIGNTTVQFEVRDSYLHEASGVSSYPYFFDTGIILFNVKNATIANNNLSSNNRNGILIHLGLGTTIINNTIYSNKDDGIYFNGAHSSSIANNTIFSNNEDGIILLDSDSNTLLNNTILSNNRYGIYVVNSNNNTFNNNEMVGNGLFIFGSMLKYWNTHFIDVTNTVNGKPVLYWKNQIGGTVPMGVGQVILANCTNIKVENQNTSDGSVGIELGFSSNNTVSNNTASSNSDKGIYIEESWNNTITNNTASNNYYGINLRESDNNIITNNYMSSNSVVGIYLHYSSSGNTIAYNNASTNNSIGIELESSSYNKITNNIASSNTVYGMKIYDSSYNIINNNNASNNLWGIGLSVSSDNNTIMKNDIFKNNDGIRLFNSINNRIFHNNIMSNIVQASDNTNNSNQWDDDYPNGGNYWSNYNGVDNFKGPRQELQGGDGIGDTPFIIDADSKDNYPLMEPFANRTFENYTTLKQGWNLISVPFIQAEQNLSKVLEMIDGYYDAVQWYDLNNRWIHHKVGKPIGNNLFKLNETMGFWIHMINPGDTIFLYNGTQPTSNQSIPLHTGWNMVGYPSVTSYNRTEGLNNLTFGDKVDAIWSYDAVTQKWEEMGVSDSFEIGKGYYIHVISECEWEVPL